MYSDTEQTCLHQSPEHTIVRPQSYRLHPPVNLGVLFMNCKTVQTALKVCLFERN